MKTKIVCVFLAIMTIGIYVIQNNQPEFGELVQANVEALSFNEWGGGNDIGGGEISWYEYQKIDIELHYCGYPVFYPDTTFLRLCDCFVKTCQGYGDLFCNGAINCDGAGL